MPAKHEVVTDEMIEVMRPAYFASENRTWTQMMRASIRALIDARILVPSTPGAPDAE